MSCFVEYFSRFNSLNDDERSRIEGVEVFINMMSYHVELSQDFYEACYLKRGQGVKFSISLLEGVRDVVYMFSSNENTLRFRDRESLLSHIIKKCV